MKAKRVALVVGGSGGIGSAVVGKLLAAGMEVWATARQVPRTPTTDGARWLPMDVTNASSVSQGIAAILKAASAIDVLVYSVSAPLKHIALLDVEWQDVEVQLLPQIQGILHCVAAIKPQLLERTPTRFILVLSDACIGNPPQGLSHYVAAKSALLGFAKSMAVELSPFGSTVNCVSPGMVKTELLEHVPAKLIEATTAKNPLRRLANPEEVASLIGFLASEAAGYLNGVNIAINGGSVIL